MDGHADADGAGGDQGPTDAGASFRGGLAREGREAPSESGAGKGGGGADRR